MHPNHIDDAAMTNFTHVRNGEHTIAEEDRVLLKQVKAKKMRSLALYLAIIAQINFQQRATNTTKSPLRLGLRI